MTEFGAKEQLHMLFYGWPKQIATQVLSIVSARKMGSITYQNLRNLMECSGVRRRFVPLR